MARHSFVDTQRKDLPVQEFWFSSLFQGLFWMACMFVITRWLGRSRLRARPASEARKLVQPVGILLISIVLLLMMAGATAASFIWPDPGTPFVAYLILAAMTSLALYLIADYVFARHDVADDGMRYGRAFGGCGRFRWEDVEHVDFNRQMQWYRIRLRSGTTVRISALLMGLPEFARTLLRQVPARRIAPATRTMLVEAENRRLGAIW